MTALHIISYLNDFDMFKRLLQYLTKNKIYIHQTKDYFGNVPNQIIINNYTWLDDIIDYYLTFHNYN